MESQARYPWDIQWVIMGIFKVKIIVKYNWHPMHERHFSGPIESCREKFSLELLVHMTL